MLKYYFSYKFVTDVGINLWRTSQLWTGIPNDYGLNDQGHFVKYQV